LHDFVFFKLNLAKELGLPDQDLSPIYSSIAQTYQDLENCDASFKYYQLELTTLAPDNAASAVKTLLNMAYMKEKLRVD